MGNMISRREAIQVSKKFLLIAVLLLCGTSLLHGQVADSTSFEGQGKPVLVTGKLMMLGGAVHAAVGGGVMLLALSPLFNPSVPEGEFSENMAAPLVFGLGAGSLLVGSALLLAGIPVTVAGHSLMQCDVPLRDARYDSRGVGVILEGGYFVPDILQARAAVGYHFNSHIFLGGGAAPGIWLDKSYRAGDISRLTLPMYADFRWSICNRTLSPYLGFSAGMEMTDISPYLAAAIGLRARSSRTSTRSFWSGLTGEVAGGYMQVGIKMGYSF